MSHLIMRAEQGVLGALLAGRDHTLITEALTADDFAHPAHQAIYSAILDLDTTDYDTEQLTAAVAAIVDRPNVDTAWLRQLATDAPDTEHVRVYAQIVIQAAFDRDTADFAQPYLTAAELAVDETTRDLLLRTGQALDSQATTFATISTIDTGSDIRLAAAVIDADTVRHREDLVIADLVQHPDQTKIVAAWLTSDVFTTEQRRTTFELAVSLGYDDEPLDAVILAWHTQRAREINTLWNPEPQQVQPRGETDYSYLARLAGTAVAVGTAVVVGHELLTEHTVATLALSAAAAAERAVQAKAIHHAPQHIDVDPPMTTQPAIDSPRIEL